MQFSEERLEEINNKYQAELDNLSLTAKSAEELIKAKNQLDLNIENKKQQISENVMNYSKKIISPSQEEFVKHKNFLNKELKKNFFN